jgi:hypothetical protein
MRMESEEMRSSRQVGRGKSASVPHMAVGPANSPDLSVIENIWGLLKPQIAARAPTNLTELKQTLEEE